MKKGLYLTLSILLAVLLCACADTGAAVDDVTPPIYEPTGTEASDIEATEATVSNTEASTPEESETAEPEETDATEPPHSGLYLPAYTTQQIIEYFQEVVLHTEFSEGEGNPALVQKWIAPLYYWVYGTPTEEDMAVLEDLFAQLNEIPGFPGIYAAEGEYYENLSISFLDPEAFRAEFSLVVNGEDAYGATQYWYYNDSNEIHTARIGYRTDLDQATRNSILVEEIINTLGVSDTVLRPDSIVYQYSDENTAPSDVDWAIIKLLYSPAIQPGMGYEECVPVIEALYY